MKHRRATFNRRVDEKEMEVDLLSLDIEKKEKELVIIDIHVAVVVKQIVIPSCS